MIVSSDAEIHIKRFHLRRGLRLVLVLLCVIRRGFSGSSVNWLRSSRFGFLGFCLVVSSLLVVYLEIWTSRINSHTMSAVGLQILNHAPNWKCWWMTMCVGHNLGMNQDLISTIFYVNALAVKQTYLRNVVSSNQIFQVANWRRQ